MSMGHIDLCLVGDNAFQDWADKQPIHRIQSFRMTGLREGTAQGNPVILWGAELPDGQVVVFETTLNLLESSIGALKARWDFEGKPYKGVDY